MCDYKFNMLERSIERLVQYDEQRREEISVIKEAVVTIKASNSQMAEAIIELKDHWKPNGTSSETSQWFKLFEKVVIALIVMIGAIVGLNPDMFLK